MPRARLHQLVDYQNFGAIPHSDTLSHEMVDDSLGDELQFPFTCVTSVCESGCVSACVPPDTPGCGAVAHGAALALLGPGVGPVGSEGFAARPPGLDDLPPAPDDDSVPP
eukprot:3777920-Amphidinium_carterae.1